MFKVRVVNKKIDIDLAMKQFHDTIADNQYTQYFWFPYNYRLLLQTVNVTDDEPNWTSEDALFKVTVVAKV